MTAALAACFLLSGFAGLIYQTAWTRQFALVFGTSELAVATVLAAYMGGLALGAWLAERWLTRIVRPVLVYAGLELGIGVSALLLVPALLLASDWALRSLFGGQSAPPDSAHTSISVFYLASAFVVLAAPTVLMGATLPLLARQAVHAESQIGSRIGFLYAMNTTGAVAGALATAFWLLPALGLTWTVRVAAAVNVLVFLLASLLARRAEAVPMHTVAHDSPPARVSLRIPAIHTPSWILPLMLLSGAVSFFHEVLWTRMLSHVLGSSIHAFGVMVASFLAGIALGGGVGALLAGTRRWAIPAFAISQLACAVTAVAAFVLISRYMPPPSRLATTASFGVMILLPLTFFIGTTFPLAVRILANSAEDAPRASARVYAWNTVGAIVGSLSAGFVLIPWLRFEGAIQVAVGASCALAVAAVWLLTRRSRAFAVALTVVAVVASVSFRPSVPDLLLRTSPLNIPNHGRILYYDVGRSASVVMFEQDGGLVLRTNGLPEAMMDMPGSPPRFSGEYWLSPLAVIARPRTESMLIVGYGGGVVIEGVPPSVQTVDVIELEPRVIAANRATQALRKRNPLRDVRVNIISNDARGALSLTSRKYDAIVSQPSHPWTAGASHLYTLEFMRQARAHLNDGGVFVQWMNVSFVDESLLRSLTATLLATFENVRIYRPDPNTLVFLGSSAPLEVEASLIASGLPLAYAPLHYGRLGIHTAEDLVAALAVDNEGAHALAAGAPLITDDDNRMATSSVYDLGSGLTPRGMGQVLAAYDPLQRAGSWIFQAFRDRLSFDYIARRQALFSAIDSSIVDRLDAMAAALAASESGHIVRVTALAARGEPQASHQLAHEGIALFPESQALRYTYIRSFIGPLAQGTATPEIASAAQGLGEPAAALIQARRFSTQQNWQGLADLDPILSHALWTDPWKFDAVQDRAEWRGRIASPEKRRQAGDECLSLIDEAIVVQPSLALYRLRARCASSAGRKDVFVESLWQLGQGTYNSGMRGPPEQRAGARRDIETIIRVLKANVPADERDGGAESARVAEVIERLNDNIQHLERL